MKFKTCYTDHLVIYNVAGDKEKIEYQLRIVDDEEQLVPVGKKDWYGYIQSHKDSVDIHKILERCALIDDYSMLNRVPTTFMDVTDMPKNLAEAFSMVKDAENYFNLMPTTIKEKYDNNYLKFISDIGSENFNMNVSDFLDSIKKKANYEINEENNNA